MEIRFAKKTDIEQIVELCKAHAKFEKADFDPKNKKELLSKHLFSANEVLKCIVVEDHNEIIGYATFMKQFSTWDACFYVYLDCLFLKEETRGKGVGYEVLKKIRSYAKTEKCDIIQWQTPDFNIDAIAFYKKLGAKAKTKERFFWEI